VIILVENAFIDGLLDFFLVWKAKITIKIFV